MNNDTNRSTPAAQPAPASTGREPIGYVSANTMEDLRRGNSVMAAILTRNDVAGVDCALYPAPVAARELDVEAERLQTFEQWWTKPAASNAAPYTFMDEQSARAWFAARSAAQSTAQKIVNVEDKLHALHAEADELGAALDRDIALYGSGGAPVSTEQAGDAWVSVEDRLPEDTAVVAIFDPENDALPVRTALWLAGSCTFESEQGWLAKDEISHWMPLPAAPSPNNSPVGADSGKDQ